MYYAMCKGISPYAPSARPFEKLEDAMAWADYGSRRSGLTYEVIKIEKIAEVGEDVKDDDEVELSR